MSTNPCACECCSKRRVGDMAASMFDFIDIASARTTEVDRLQGILNSIHGVLVELGDGDGWRMPAESLPNAIRRLAHVHEEKQP